MIIDKLRINKPEDFRKLVDKYKNKIFNVCYRLVWNYDDADDCAQETFIKVYKNLDKYNPKYPFSPWLYRIAINTCYDFLRKKRETLALDETFVAESRISNIEELETKEREKIVQKAVERLPNKYKSAVVLYYFEEQSIAEISETLKISQSAVKTNLFRARKKLAKILELRTMNLEL